MWKFIIIKIYSKQAGRRFFCEKCEEDFEFKAKQKLTKNSQWRIVDGAYTTMIDRITSLNNPHLLYMEYLQTQVINLLMIPKFFFIPEIIEKRKPLSPTARRAGWIGCNINISNIPKTGRIEIVFEGFKKKPQQVIDEYQKASLIKTNKIENRSWLLDLLSCIENLPVEFNLQDVYRFTNILSIKHPNNNNVEAKIRQQLQILRDKRFIKFIEKGVYRKL